MLSKDHSEMESFVEIGLGFYSLLQTRSITKKLTKTADKYNVDPHTASAFLQLSSKQ